VGVPSGPLGWISTRTVFLLPGPMYQVIGDALQLHADDELLDVACGSGAFLARQAGHVHRVAGIDLSDIQIVLARRHLGERIAAGTAEVVHGDAGALPWPDESFTAVTCMAAFEAFPAPAKVLAEMFRVLRPGGRVVLNIGEQVAPGTQTHRAWGEIWVWAEDDVRRMVNDAGFTDVTIRYAPAWGNGPVSKLLARLAGPLGGDLRLVRAIKQ
jgi:SAM-dependent methyltransferase